MRFSDTIGRSFGIQLHWHWSCFFVMLFLFVHGWWTTTLENSVLNVAVFVTFLILLFIHELFHVQIAKRFGIRTRDIFIYPVCTLSRLACLSDRPRKEMWIAFSGILFSILLTIGFSLILFFNQWTFQPHLLSGEVSPETFFHRLFWSLVLFVIVNLLPIFPFDGGVMLRASLAMTASRLRSTEIVSTLGAIIAIGFVLLDLFWLQRGWLALLGVFVFMMNQFELAQMQAFAQMNQELNPNQVSPIRMVPIEQLLDPETRPTESNFSGFIWNSRVKMWIEWRNGEPVSANAVLGD